MEQKPDSLKSLQNKLYLPAMVLGGLAILVVASMSWFGEVGMANPKDAEGIGLWVNFLGQFHPLFLHLPIGALMLVFVLEAAKLATRGRYQPNTTMALFFASVTGVFAVIFGYFLFLTGGYEGELIEEHKRDGIIFTILLIGSFMLKFTLDVKPSWKVVQPSYWVGLAATGAVMMSAGHHGGEISHGDPLAQLPSTIIDQRLAEKNAPVDLDPVVYTGIIHPILENKCISCHGEDKQKGGLRMDSMLALIEGGEEGDCLVPGDLKKSKMVSYLHLPEDDDLHMPPSGKTQLTAEEVKILEWWVAMGAPEAKRRSEVTITPEIEAALATLLTPEERARQEQAARDAALAEQKAVKEKREKLAAALKSVNQRFPGSLKYVSQSGTDLIFSAVSYREQFSDSDIELLLSAADAITEINLGSVKITDKGVANLEKFVNLKSLKLSETSITDAALKSLVKLPALEVLNLYGTKVTDGGLAALMGHQKLLKVYLWGSQVTPAGAEKLMQALSKNQSDAQAKLSEKERHGKEVPKAEVHLGVKA